MTEYFAVGKRRDASTDQQDRRFGLCTWIREHSHQARCAVQSIAVLMRWMSVPVLVCDS